MKAYLIFFLLLVSVQISAAQVPEKLQISVDKMAGDIESTVIDWRRHFHQNPELSNREFKTAEKIAEHLQKLGLEVETKVAHTGVVGLLKGKTPGPVIALRADMDALPVTERNNLPFASTVITTYNGQETGVMHACGHDSHVAILMGVAEILSKHKEQLKGTIKFIFQPAEEGAPEGEEGGAELMVKEGVLENPKVDVIFGLHISAMIELGKITFTPGAMMAASDWFTIKVKGRQAHGAAPWKSIDPIVISSQIINGLQTIVSRQTDLTQQPVIITVGTIHSGIRENIIPEEAVMTGTIRTLDKGMQKEVHQSILKMATGIAQANGALAEISFDGKTPVTYNQESLANQVLPSLERTIGKANIIKAKPVTGAEDFAFFVENTPGFYFFVGARPANLDPGKAPSHHTPDFMIDEKAFLTGLKAMLNLTLDFMFQK